MSGSVNFGKCEICKTNGVPLTRSTFRYKMECECHNPCHFIIVEHCKDCTPKEPRETKITMSTEKLKNSVLVNKNDNVIINKDTFEHLLNCMCNQKFIHEQPKAIQDEWQEIIDKAYHEARALLSPVKEEK